MSVCGWKAVWHGRWSICARSHLKIMRSLLWITVPRTRPRRSRRCSVRNMKSKIWENQCPRCRCGFPQRCGIEPRWRGGIYGHWSVYQYQTSGRGNPSFETQPQIEYINGSRFARESDTKGRKWYRKITSQGLLILLKLFLRMKSTDAICGFTFVRRQTALSLIAGCSQDNGWFYMIEFLLRAEKRGVKILDYPVEWQEDYNTTVKVFKTICNYLVQIARLFNEFYIKKHI